MKLTSVLYKKLVEEEPKLKYEYRALTNMRSSSQNANESSTTKFITTKLKFNELNALEILPQDSYDNSINLIITDGEHDPVIINTGFAKVDNKVYFPKHYSKNDSPTNVYQEQLIDRQTKLFTTVNRYPKISLKDVSDSGNLMGGNYIVYLRYTDNDSNLTDIVAESGVISIFNGD